MSTYVNARLAVVPCTAVVTITSTVPAPCAGVITVMFVSLFTTNEVAVPSPSAR